MSKRTARPLLITAAVFLVAVFLAACSSPAASTSSTSTGGDVSIGWAEPVDSLNPAVTGARDVGPIDSNIFDGLVWLTPALKATPHLATSWKISPDGKTYTFTLEKGVKFQDNTPFNASSVVANIKYITAKTTQSTIAIGLLGPCLQAKALSEYTVEINCSTPYAPLLNNLGEPYLGMQSPAAITKWGADLGMHPTGTGPFEFVSYVPNQSVVLKRNPAYNWAAPATGVKGPAKLSKLTFNIVTDSQARVASLQSGQTQMIQETPGIYFKSLKNSFTQVRVPISGQGIFAPINASKFPTNDLAVRQAILLSVNKKTLIQASAQGVFSPTYAPLVGMPDYSVKSLSSMYPYNPKKADQLLIKDGWTKTGKYWMKGGKELDLSITAISTVPAYPLVAQALQSQLQANGMNVTVSQLATPAWLNSNVNGDMSMTPLQYVAADPAALDLWFTPGQYYNWSHYTNPKLTALIKAGEATSVISQREKIYAQAQTLIMQEAVMLPLYENEDLVLTSKKLTGITYAGGGFEYFLGAALSKS
jgi:peptide/nickel transport system substrate-binding protein